MTELNNGIMKMKLGSNGGFVGWPVIIACACVFPIAVALLAYCFLPHHGHPHPVTLPAVLTSPRLPDGQVMAAPPEPMQFSIERPADGVVALNVPPFVSLYESDTGLQGSWIWMRDCYESVQLTIMSDGPFKFYGVRPFRP